MPKGLLVRLHPVQILVFICRAKQPHGLRRMWVSCCRRTSFGALEVCFWGSYSFSVSLRSSFIV